MVSLVHYLTWAFLRAGKKAILKRWQRHLLDQANHVEDLSDIVVGFGPDDLVAPRLRNMGDGDAPCQRIAPRVVRYG
jgi:hypothetical protein